MTGLVAVLTVVVVGGAFLLVWSALGHLRHYSQLRAVIVTHAIVPYPRHRVAASAFVATELAVGGTLLFAVVVGEGTIPLRVPAAAQALLYAVLSGYTLRLLARGRLLDCGCFGQGESTTILTLARTGVVALASVGVAVMGPAMPGLVPSVAALLGMGGLVALGLRYVTRLGAPLTHVGQAKQLRRT